MIELIKKLTAHEVSHADLSAAKTLSLPIDLRIKSRQRVTLEDGAEAGLFLERGTLLRGGDIITDGQGILVRVVAADETVSTVRCADPLLLAKIAYHLGNRHVSVQIGSGWIRYLQDHVLDGMLRELGLEPEEERAPFEPETGAYNSHAHSHAPT